MVPTTRLGTQLQRLIEHGRRVARRCQVSACWKVRVEGACWELKAESDGSGGRDYSPRDLAPF